MYNPVYSTFQCVQCRVQCKVQYTVLCTLKLTALFSVKCHCCTVSCTGERSEGGGGGDKLKEKLNTMSVFISIFCSI